MMYNWRTVMQRNLMVAVAGSLLLALAGCAGKSAVKAPPPAVLFLVNSIPHGSFSVAFFLTSAEL